MSMELAKRSDAAPRKITTARKGQERQMLPDAVQRFGPLSEAVNVKGAIVLEQVSRTGMHVDRDRLLQLRQSKRAEVEALVERLRALPEANGLFKVDRKGMPMKTGTGLPSMHAKVLDRVLKDELARLHPAGLPEVPRNAGGTLSTASDHWLPYESGSAFVKAWLGVRSVRKELAFLELPDSERVHPRYTTLVRTGRTSCSKPNLQQVPRKGGFRECFTASPGHCFLTIDYSFIELVTLAATCLQRHGESRLADVISQGSDPHCHTASLIAGMQLDELLALKKSDPVRYKDLRQRAKAVNFGIPGGMGPDALRAYAKQNYGVALTLDDARKWRETLIAEVYPELKLYLSDRTMDALALHLGCTAEVLWSELDSSGQRPGWLPGVLRKILAGCSTKKDGTPYDPAFLDRVWAGLCRCCHDPNLRQRLLSRKTGAVLSALCDEEAVTLTGRVRTGIGYTEGRNTPFQGLASDGAKLACFDLLRARYKVIGFVHDEFVIELPVEADHAREARRIEQIVCDAMSQVIDHTVPVSAEYALSTCWSKEAKCLIDDQGRLLPWSPVRI